MLTAESVRKRGAPSADIIVAGVLVGCLCVCVESLCRTSHLHRATGSVSSSHSLEKAVLVSALSGPCAVGYFSYARAINHAFL